jgi:hypothetical protein
MRRLSFILLTVIIYILRKALSETDGLQQINVTSVYLDPTTGKLLINGTEWFTPSNECAAEGETYPGVTETKFWIYAGICVSLVLFGGLMVTFSLAFLLIFQCTLE